MNFEITQADVDQMPEEHRAKWQELVDARARGREEMRLAEERGEWNKVLTYQDSGNRAPALIRAAATMEGDELRELVGHWWSTTEAWSAVPELRDGMYDMIRRAAPVRVYADEAVGRPVPPETGEMTVYRGNLGEEPHGGSWSLERDVAERFARMAMSPRGMFLGMYRADGVPSVWRGTVKAEDVLGFFDDRQESEIVTDVVSNVELVAKGLEES